MIARNGSSVPSVTYAEAIEVALCFGRIDGQKAGHDDGHVNDAKRPETRRRRIATYLDMLCRGERLHP